MRPLRQRRWSSAPPRSISSCLSPSLRASAARHRRGPPSPLPAPHIAFSASPSPWTAPWRRPFLWHGFPGCLRHPCTWPPCTALARRCPLLPATPGASSASSSPYRAPPRHPPAPQRETNLPLTPLHSGAVCPPCAPPLPVAAAPRRLSGLAVPANESSASPCLFLARSYCLSGRPALTTLISRKSLAPREDKKMDIQEKARRLLHQANNLRPGLEDYREDKYED